MVAATPLPDVWDPQHVGVGGRVGHNMLWLYGHQYNQTTQKISY